MKKIKPGNIAGTSGLYQIIGPRGGKGDERTIVKGEPFPPTPKPNSSYQIVRKTKH